MTVEIDIAVSSPARLGEGAVWDTEDACLWWVDIKAGLIHRFDPATGVNAALILASRWVVWRGARRAG